LIARNSCSAIAFAFLVVIPAGNLLLPLLLSLLLLFGVVAAFRRMPLTFQSELQLYLKPPKYLSFRPTNGSGETSAFRECLHHPKSQMGQFGPYWLLLYGK